MAGVDAELRWGDERLELESHPLDAVIAPALGPFALRPFEVDGDDLLLTVPPRAEARIRTANGMRDVAVLRVLGCVAPHPDVEGAARVRIRRLRDADEIPEGVVLTDRVEAWLGIDGWWLRLRVSEAPELPLPPRFEPRALRSYAALAAFVMTLFAGALTALGSVPPREASLGVSPLEGAAARRLRIRVLAPARARERDETKADVAPRATGGGVVDPFVAPSAAAAHREAPEPSLEGREAPPPDEREARAAGREGPAEGAGAGLGERARTPAPSVRFPRRRESEGPRCLRLWSGGCRDAIDDRARRRIIARIVRRLRRRMLRCYERGLAVQAGLAGRGHPALEDPGRRPRARGRDHR